MNINTCDASVKTSVKEGDKNKADEKDSNSFLEFLNKFLKKSNIEKENTTSKEKINEKNKEESTLDILNTNPLISLLKNNWQDKTVNVRGHLEEVEDENIDMSLISTSENFIASDLESLNLKTETKAREILVSEKTAVFEEEPSIKLELNSRSTAKVKLSLDEPMVKTDKEELLSKEVQIPRPIVDSLIKEVSNEGTSIKSQETVEKVGKEELFSKEVQIPRSIVDSIIEEASKEGESIKSQETVEKVGKEELFSKEVQRLRPIIDSLIKEVSDEALSIKSQETVEKGGKKELLSKEDIAMKVQEDIVKIDKEHVIGKDVKISKDPLDILTEEVFKVADDVDNNNLTLISKTTKSKENIEKPIQKLDQKPDTAEIAKSIDSNFISNRVQNAFLNLNEINDKLSLENLQGIEDSIVKFMEVSKEGDSSVMKVRLYPEELGSINISLKLSEGKLIADIIVGSEKIKELFLNSSNILNRALIEQNLPIKSINVSVDDAFNSFEGFNEERDHGQARDEHFQKQNINKNLNENPKLHPLDELRINKVNRESKSLNILV